MADQFIGLVMLVTLSSPPDAQLRGKVSSVVAGQSLTLHDVTSPNGNWIAEITIRASDIKDLVEAPVEKVNSLQPGMTLPPSKPPILRAFEDPAILSMGKRPGSGTLHLEALGEVINVERIPRLVTLPSVLDTPLQPLQSAMHRKIHKEEIAPSLGLTDSMQKVAIAGERAATAVGSDLELGGNTEKKIKKQPRRRQKKSNAQMADVRNGDEAVHSMATRGKGWRQTPLLEPTSSFQPFSTLKKQSRKGFKATDNGWATEDATDVQEMGDFDFEGNLSKFDKRTVFEGIKADDMTADEDRLVGHNRLPRPGTAGGKNLHYTENVLDHKNDRDVWKSEAGESDIEYDNLSQRGSGSGRTSRRAESRLRRPIQRKESSFNNSGAGYKSAFYHLPANKRCEVVSALQTLNLENIMDNELGLSEDMMTENAGRGLAQVVLMVVERQKHPPTQDTTPYSPFVVICAGNNKSGQRAIAAARHLRNHGVHVIVCGVGLEREAELLEPLRRQIKVFRAFGGKIVSKPDLMENIKSLGISTIDLIVDGLLGLTISFDELRTGDQAAAYELIEWSNRSRAKVLAIDIPAGIDPSSGKVSIIDGHPLYMQPNIIAAMGAPKKGLLQAMIMGEGSAWELFLVDIGIANQAWKKGGTRMRRGVEFEDSWVIEMRFQKSED